MFYLALGAAIGVAATRRVNRAVRAWRPEAVAGRLGENVRDFAAEVRAGMVERENELRAAITEGPGDHGEDGDDGDAGDERDVRKTP